VTLKHIAIAAFLSAALSQADQQPAAPDTPPAIVSKPLTPSQADALKIYLLQVKNRNLEIQFLSAEIAALGRDQRDRVAAWCKEAGGKDCAIDLARGALTWPESK